MALGTITFTAVAVNRIYSAQPSYVDLVVQCDGGTEFTIERNLVVGTGSVIVRGADHAAATGPDLFHKVDHEPPAGYPLNYTVTVSDGVDTATAYAQAEPVDHGGDWLMPVSRPELGMLITVEKGGAGALQRDLQHSTATVINRSDPVVVSFGRKMWKGTWTLLTLNDDERVKFLQVLLYSHLMFTPRPGFGFEEPIFCVMGEVTEQRVVGWGGETARRWGVEVIQIARPPATYVPPPPQHTWQSRLTEASTWAEVVNSFVDWFDYSGYGDVDTGPVVREVSL